MATDFSTMAASVPESEDAIRNLKASESVTAAFIAAGVPNPPGDLANIVSTYVKSATKDIPLNQIAYMAPGSGALGTSAATGVTMFFNALTTAQRDAVKQGINPLDPAAMMKFNAMINGPAASGGVAGAREGGAGRATSEAYTRELAGGSVFKTLSSEGYAPAQINSAIDYARSLGASEDMARKFIKLDKTSRDDLQTFVDDVRNDVSLTDEQKAAKVAAFRKGHPKIGKTLTDQDMLKVIRGDDKRQIKLRGVESSTHTDTQQEKHADNVRSGIASGIDTKHGADVASAERKPDQAKADLDVFAAVEKRAQSREVAETKPATLSKPNATAAKTGPKASHASAAPNAPHVAHAPAKSPSCLGRISRGGMATCCPPRTESKSR